MKSAVSSQPYSTTVWFYLRHRFLAHGFCTGSFHLLRQFGPDVVTHAFAQLIHVRSDTGHGDGVNEFQQPTLANAVAYEFVGSGWHEQKVCSWFDTATLANALGNRDLATRLDLAYACAGVMHTETVACILS